MTGPYDPYGPRPDDLETRLAEALRNEADKVIPAGDGLAKIRARTEGRAGAFAWLSRPAAVGGILAVALVAATLVGTQLGGDDPDSVVVEGPNGPVQPFAAAIPNSQADAERIDPTPEPSIGPEGGQDFEVDTEVTDPPLNAVLIAPVTPEQERRQSDNGIPVDNGGNYVSIQAPLSGRTYDSPLTLTGQARVFEAAVTIDISQNGKVLKQAHATATAGAPELGDWQATIALAPGNYRIDAYALSPEDGVKRLASDSIWITVRAPAGSPTPSPYPTPTPSSSPSAGPTSTASPSATTQSRE